MTTRSLQAVVQGTPVTELPTGLYVPPEALQVFLESFEGPLDLLLYLIQHQNVDIFDIPIAEITRQYLQYIGLMEEFNLDLAAEYLVMAATLSEIKSRLLLPTQTQQPSEDVDPRTQLVQQLQEYARYKKAAQEFATLPQVGYDIFPVWIEKPVIPHEIILPQISQTTFLAVMREVMERASFFSSHQIQHEPLSVRERMSLILEALKQSPHLDFVNLFTLEEGRAGVVVTLLASLELVKETLIQIVQQQPFEAIQMLPLESESE